jgi:tRNA(Ile2)-agmatinylcytidine synthase|tara:strand:+ start:1085 stop:2383 length:1299 start_codon:yes stop_codon:yes gene_type:complete
MLHIGIDDTDSLKGGCTTWLATEVIQELSEFDLIGYPRLVRLNPNVPWKTRGNGAVALTLGKGIGLKKLIGEFDGKSFFTFEKGIEIEYRKEQILERVLSLMDKHSMPDSEPGVVVSDSFLPEGLYWQGVSSIVTKDMLLESMGGAISSGLRGSRGIFGAACSLAWSGSITKVNGISHTWELIGYRNQDNWGTKRNIDNSVVQELSNIETVFSCNDLDGKVAMVPNSPCPVLWGFRGTDGDKLIQNFEKLGPEIPSRWLLYKTNQATDDHLRYKEISEMKDGDSVNIEITVISNPSIIKGGHRFFGVKDKFDQTAQCAAFEPTKNFRHIIDKLEIGDYLVICGSVNNGTINLEKLRILDLVPRFLKPANPFCDCGQRTHSSGKNSYYRCKSCSKRYDRPDKVEISSDLELKWYEPPASSRRHLSTPISLMHY